VSATPTPTPAPTPPPEPTPPPKAPEAGNSFFERLKLVGGLAAVVVGTIAVAVIAIVAIVQNSGTSAQFASSTAGVIATIVGAYFGIKVGTDQTKTALEGQKAEAAKAQTFAAHVPEKDAPNILALAEKAARDVLR